MTQLHTLFINHLGTGHHSLSCRLKLTSGVLRFINNIEDSMDDFFDELAWLDSGEYEFATEKKSM